VCEKAGQLSDAGSLFVDVGFDVSFADFGLTIPSGYAVRTGCDSKVFSCMGTIPLSAISILREGHIMLLAEGTIVVLELMCV
jgi:hypothetical protein